MHFEFATAGRILFGPGRLRELGPLVAGFGTRALVVGGARGEFRTLVEGLLAPVGVATVPWVVRHEPTLAGAASGAEFARGERVEVVVAIGGGSVLDAGKAIAALAMNPGDPLEYVEVIGRGRPLGADPLPLVAIPTTAGTGSEVTRNAVLSSPEHQVKVSLRSPRMLPRVALVDPELTLGLSPALTATTGLDALTQLLEAYVCTRANPMTDGLCREGLVRIARALPEAWRNGTNVEARAGVQWAAMFSGLALANAGLGAVHGFAGPIGGRFDAPHGAVCAALLAPVTAANVAALRARAPEGGSLARYGEAAQWLTGRPDATVDDLAPHLAERVASMGIRGLGAHGVSEREFPELIRQARSASSMKANPVALSDAELGAVLLAAL
ncbi:MAG: iron-containing alcohol dehydrogenase [Verrucomicrobiales bacterium]|nr:iron-containing alcohol dehydrogenase [Verrucomicrobiales bacterium]